MANYVVPDEQLFTLPTALGLFATIDYVDDEVDLLEEFLTNNYYNVTEVDNLLSSYYTAIQVNTLLSGYYTAVQVDTLLTGYVTDAELVTALGSYVTLTGVQTLTNKTLTSPAINTPTLVGGTIDNTPVGATVQAAGTFTTLKFSTNLATSNFTTPSGIINLKSDSTFLVVEPTTSNLVNQILRVNNQAGSERVRITYDSLNVLYGIAVGAVVTTPQVTIDGSGRVGVGITLPSGQLHLKNVTGSASDNIIIAQDTTVNGNSGGGLEIWRGAAGVSTLLSRFAMAGYATHYLTTSIAGDTLITTSTSTSIVLGNGSTGAEWARASAAGIVNLIPETTRVTDATTTAVVNVLTLGKNVTGAGVGGIGMGVGLLFTGESSTTVDREMGRVRYAWTTATDLSRASSVVLSIFNVGVETDIFTANINGAFIPLPLQITGASGGLLLSPRDGSGITFQWYNPTGDNLKVHNGTGDIFTLNSIGNITSPAQDWAMNYPNDGNASWALTNTHGGISIIKRASASSSGRIEFQPTGSAPNIAFTNVGGGTNILSMEMSTLRVTVGTAGASTARLNVNGGASEISQIIRANVTTPGDFLQLQDSTGAIWGKFEYLTAGASMRLLIPSGGDALARLGVSNTVFSNFYWYSDGVGAQHWASGAAAADIKINRNTSGGGLIIIKEGTPNLAIPTLTINTAGVQTGDLLNLTSLATGAIPLLIRGGSGQTVNLIRTQFFDGSSSFDVFTVGASGATGITARDANTASVTYGLILGKNNTTGTPGAGMGVGLGFRGQSSTTVDRDMAAWEASWSVATDLSRVGQLIGYVYNIGVKTTVLTLSPTLITGAKPITISLSDTTDSSTIALFSSISNITTGSKTVLAGILYANAASTTPNFTAVLGRVLSSGGNPYSAGTVIGVDGNVNYQASSGTMLVATGINSRIQNTGAGTISAAHGMYIQTPVNSGGGAITTSYGIYLENQNVGTTPYAIYTNAGLVRFGGNTEIIGELRTDTLRLDVTPTVIGVLIATHTVPMNFNGTIYNVLVAA